MHGTDVKNKIHRLFAMSDQCL